MKILSTKFSEATAYGPSRRIVPRQCSGAENYSLVSIGEKIISLSRVKVCCQLHLRSNGKNLR